MAVLNQWETDIQKSKEAEEKLSNMFKQQQKLFQQQRVVQAQRLKTIKQLQEQYIKVGPHSNTVPCSVCASFALVEYEGVGQLSLQAASQHAN